MMTNLEFASFVDEKYKSILSKEYADIPAKYRELTVIEDSVKIISLVNFFNLYSDSKFNLRDLDESVKRARESRLLKILSEMKFQMMMIQIEISKSNGYFAGKYEEEEINSNDSLLILKLSIQQNLIIKNRILWEKVMNFIYYLEFNKLLGTMRSKKGIFFKSIANTKWKFLLKYEDIISTFDSKHRTPEIHDVSELSNIFHEKVIDKKTFSDPSEGILIYNLVNNIFGNNLCNIMKDEEPCHEYWDIGMEYLKEKK